MNNEHGLKLRRRTYTGNEVKLLLKSVKEVLPCDGEEWMKVSEHYNCRVNADRRRDGESLKRKFTTLRKSEARTGNGEMNILIKEALSIDRKIGNKLNLECGERSESEENGESEESEDDESKKRRIELEKEKWKQKRIKVLHGYEKARRSSDSEVEYVGSSSKRHGAQDEVDLQRMIVEDLHENPLKSIRVDRKEKRNERKNRANSDNLRRRDKIFREVSFNPRKRSNETISHRQKLQESSSESEVEYYRNSQVSKRRLPQSSYRRTNHKSHESPEKSSDSSYQSSFADPVCSSREIRTNSLAYKSAEQAPNAVHHHKSKKHSPIKERSRPFNTKEHLERKKEIYVRNDTSTKLRHRESATPTPQKIKQQEVYYQKTPPIDGENRFNSTVNDMRSTKRRRIAASIEETPQHSSEIPFNYQQQESPERNGLATFSRFDGMTTARMATNDDEANSKYNRSHDERKNICNKYVQDENEEVRSLNVDQYVTEGQLKVNSSTPSNSQFVVQRATHIGRSIDPNNCYLQNNNPDKSELNERRSKVGTILNFDREDVCGHLEESTKRSYRLHNGNIPQFAESLVKETNSHLSSPPAFNWNDGKSQFDEQTLRETKNKEKLINVVHDLNDSNKNPSFCPFNCSHCLKLNKQVMENSLRGYSQRTQANHSCSNIETEVDGTSAILEAAHQIENRKAMDSGSQGMNDSDRKQRLNLDTILN